MLQAGLLDKGLLPNEMQGVLLEEWLPSTELRAVCRSQWHLLLGLAQWRYILTCTLCFKSNGLFDNDMQAVLLREGLSSSELRARFLKGGGWFLMACELPPEC